MWKPVQHRRKTTSSNLLKDPISRLDPTSVRIIQIPRRVFDAIRQKTLNPIFHFWSDLIIP